MRLPATLLALTLLATAALAGGPTLAVTAVGATYEPPAGRAVVRQTQFDGGGSTSVRNEPADALEWKAAGYYQRSRDLGQTFTAPRDFTLAAVVLRTGPSDAAVLAGAPGAPVFVQFFAVTGTPRVNDNGTPPGTAAKHGFGNNHRCDDFLEGVTYEPLGLARGGAFPDLPPTRDAAGNPTGKPGKLVYLRWAFAGDRPRFAAGKRYAFVVGVAEPGANRGFTLANRNLAASADAPALGDRRDPYAGGWGLRREGDGTVPPKMAPGDPPAGAARDPFLKQSLFAAGDARYALSPTTDGYPDVDTYRDLEFTLEAADAPPK